MKTTLVPTIALYLVTMAHHVYGGFVLDSTERLVISAVFTVVIGATVWLHRLGRYSRWARAGYGMLVVLWVAVVGLVEGGYNHALFVVLRLSGASSDTFARLYPEGVEGAESSGDVFFQGTGVLTLLAVIPILVIAVRRP